MSQPFSGNGDPGAVMANGHPDLPAPRAEASAGVAHVRPGTQPGAHRATGVRPPHKPDWRLQSLSTEPGHHHVPAPPDGTDRPRWRRRHPFLVGTAVFIAVVALAALLLQAFVVQPFAVPGQMMAPAIQAGDRILVVKLGLLEDPIRTGEVVVLRSPRSAACTAAGGDGADLVLRVVALPGQTIWSLGNAIVVDGRPLRERGWYDPRSGQVGPTPVPATTLARNQYFVMGDNRAQACDSRAFGPISKSSIVGEGIAIVVRHGHVFFRSL
jgi:signal peptidase I